MANTEITIKKEVVPFVGNWCVRIDYASPHDIRFYRYAARDGTLSDRVVIYKSREQANYIEKQSPATFDLNAEEEAAERRWARIERLKGVIML